MLLKSITSQPLLEVVTTPSTATAPNQALRTQCDAIVVSPVPFGDEGPVLIKAGTAVNLPDAIPPGSDVDVYARPDGTLTGLVYNAIPVEGDCLLIGGCHFAPGGNSPAFAGGDSVPQFNPSSAWDLAWRPVARNPRGMAIVGISPFNAVWVDIYLATDNYEADKDNDRARHGAAFLVDRDAWQFAALASKAGKRLLNEDEFRAAAIGVTERTSSNDWPRLAALDAPRTSRCGLMQATGNLWTRGALVADPDAFTVDSMRAPIYGANWYYGSNAGSRASTWGDAPSNSSYNIGARFACDHLTLP